MNVGRHPVDVPLGDVVAPELAVRAAPPRQVVVDADQRAQHVDPCRAQRAGEARDVRRLAPLLVVVDPIAVGIEQQARRPCRRLRCRRWRPGTPCGHRHPPFSRSRARLVNSELECVQLHVAHHEPQAHRPARDGTHVARSPIVRPLPSDRLGHAVAQHRIGGAEVEPRQRMALGIEQLDLQPAAGARVAVERERAPGEAHLRGGQLAAAVVRVGGDEPVAAQRGAKDAGVLAQLPLVLALHRAAVQPLHAGVVHPQLVPDRDQPRVRVQHAAGVGAVQAAAQERLAAARAAPAHAVPAGQELHVHGRRKVVLAPVVERRRQHQVDVLGPRILHRAVGVEVDVRARIVALPRHRDAQVLRVRLEDDLQRRPLAEVRGGDPADAPVAAPAGRLCRLIDHLGVADADVADVQLQPVVPEQHVLHVAHGVARVGLIGIGLPVNAVRRVHGPQPLQRAGLHLFVAGAELGPQLVALPGGGAVVAKHGGALAMLCRSTWGATMLFCVDPRKEIRPSSGFLQWMPSSDSA